VIGQAIPGGPPRVRSARFADYPLGGLVEVDEGYVDGEEHGEGLRGRGRRGVRRKSVVGVAMERRGTGRPGEKPVPGLARSGGNSRRSQGNTGELAHG